MFSRSRRSAATVPASPPSAVIVGGRDDGCCSSSASSEEGLEPHYDYCNDSLTAGSQDESYGISNDTSKQGKKKSNNRSLVDEIRLCFLTGRLSRLVLHGILLLAVGLTTYAISSKLFRLMISRESPLGLTVKPVMMAMYFTDVSSQSFTGRVQRILPPRNRDQWLRLLEPRLQPQHRQEEHRHHRHHLILPVEPLSEKLEDIEEDSEWYEDEKPEITPNPDKCVPQYDWQTATYPSCNNVHENSILWDRMYLKPHSPQPLELHHSRGLRRSVLENTSHHRHDFPHQFQYLAHGYWRDTWMLHTEHELVAFKTMRIGHKLTEYLVDKQRRDAVTSDRLTFSQHAIHMYGYCGTSAYYEYAPGGDLERFIDRFETATDFTEYYPPPERLVLAFNVTSALADVHTTEGPDSVPAIVHGDFKSDQFVAVTKVQKGDRQLPHFKLGDFNLARFVYWDDKHNHPCVIKPDGNGGKNRAPEEYAKRKGRTEKLDIYSLGNILYTILTGHFPFDDLDADGGSSTEVAKELVKQGRRPHVNIDANIRQSKDPYERTMLEAIEMCWKQDPHERASAREVEAVLGRLLPKEHEYHHRRHRALRRLLH